MPMPTLLRKIELAANISGLNINTDKTEYIKFNQNNNLHMEGIYIYIYRFIYIPTLHIGVNMIKRVEDFKYLVSYIKSTDRYVNIRIAKAWAALNNMQSIWKSKLSEGLKINFFRAASESVLVYGSVTWTLT